jgi:hypothetical protein
VISRSFGVRSLLSVFECIIGVVGRHFLFFLLNCWEWKVVCIGFILSVLYEKLYINIISVNFLRKKKKQ